MSPSQQKGTAFETSIARGLASARDDDRIERRARTGAKDRGDIAGMRFGPHKIVLECKNCARTELPEWVKQAHQEAENDGALVGLVVHKRKGVTDPMQQWVTGTVADLVALCNAVQESPKEDIFRSGGQTHQMGPRPRITVAR